MDIRFKNDANHNYMIIKKERGPVNINHEKMAIRNNIEGLLRINLHFIDNEAFYYYEIRSKQSLKHLFEGRYISGTELTAFFKGMVKVFRELEQYLLPSEGIIFDPEYIYVDIDTCRPEFAFFPSAASGRGDDLTTLARFFIDHADRNDSRAQQLAYDYYEAVTEGIISPEGLIGSVSEERNIPVSYEEDSFKGGDNEGSETGFDYWETQEDMSKLDYFLKSDPQKERDKGILKIAGICLGLIIVSAVFYLVIALNPALIPSLKMNETEYITAGCIIALLFGAAVTVVIFVYNRQRMRQKENEMQQKKELLEKNVEDPFAEAEMRGSSDPDDEDEDKKTTLLSFNKSMGRGATLTGNDQGRYVCFFLDQSPFVIGKKGDKANGILSNPAVSRIHASIRENNGRYFLSDMNSTNGTFVNGRRLELNETVVLEDGDNLGFAGTVLSFRNQMSCPAG